MRTMYDAVTPANLPAGGDLYAGYIDGHYANIAAIQAMFPGKKVVTITVTGNVEADVVDVETGDVTPAHAPAWVLRMRAAGRVPTVYCPESMWAAVRAAFAQQGVPEPSYWIANYTSAPAIPAGAVAHQYGGTGGHDISSVADYWPGVDPAPPVVSPLAAAPTKETEFMQATQHIVNVGPLDPGGNGIGDSPAIAGVAVGPDYNGTAYDLNPAHAAMAYDEPDGFEWESYLFDGVLRIEVKHGRPGATYAFRVTDLHA